jgi:hypothetical protein
MAVLMRQHSIILLGRSTMQSAVLVELERLHLQGPLARLVPIPYSSVLPVSL